MFGRIFTICLSAVAVHLTVFGVTYSLEQVTSDLGGGASESSNYSSESSLGGVFFGPSGLTSYGASLRFGFISELHDPPLAPLNELQRTRGQPLVISVAALLSRVIDIEGQSFTLVAVSQASQQGVPIAFAGDTISYQSSSEENSLDAFGYTVADEFGASAEGIVVVRTGTPDTPAPVLAIQVAGQTVRLNFGGVPGHNYQIQASESLSSPNWRNVGNAVGAATGSFTFVDRSAGGFRTRYYRSVEL